MCKIKKGMMILIEEVSYIMESFNGEVRVFLSYFLFACNL
jgi:hypothetical protein